MKCHQGGIVMTIIIIIMMVVAGLTVTSGSRTNTFLEAGGGPRGGSCVSLNHSSGARSHPFNNPHKPN